MHRWLGRSFALLVGLLLAGSAWALPTGQALVISGGASFPTQPNRVSDNWNTGYALSGGLFWRAAPTLSLGVEVGYYRHPLNTDAFQAMFRDAYPDVSVSGHQLWIMPLSAVGELDLLRWGVVKPFLRAGFGVYTFGITPLEASGPGAEEVRNQVAADPRTQDLDGTVFGTLIGFGVHTPITPMLTLIVDATYHVANTTGEATHFIPVRVGLRF